VLGARGSPPAEGFPPDRLPVEGPSGSAVVCCPRPAVPVIRASTRREIVTLISLRWSYFLGSGSTAEVLTGNAPESYRIADAGGLSAGRLTPALLASFLVALLFGSYVLLTGFCRER